MHSHRCRCAAAAFAAVVLVLAAPQTVFAATCSDLLNKIHAGAKSLAQAESTLKPYAGSGIPRQMQSNIDAAQTYASWAVFGAFAGNDVTGFLQLARDRAGDAASLATGDSRTPVRQAGFYALLAAIHFAQAPGAACVR